MNEQSIVSTAKHEVMMPSELMNIAIDFAKNALSKNTRKKYADGWKSFIQWCESHRVDPIKTQDKESLIAFYASEKASLKLLKTSSITCYVAGICHTYLENGFIINTQHPSVREVLKGIRREHHTRPACKEPILTEDLRKMIEAIPVEKDGQSYLNGIRDRSLLLLGFAGAFRRSELVGLNIEDISFCRDGILTTLKRSKTDQEGKSEPKAIPYGSNPLTCPVRALKDWLEASQITSGPLYRMVNKHGQIQAKRLTSHAIALIIKRNEYISDRSKELLKQARGVSQLDSARLEIESKKIFSGHSLRAGFVTSAAKRKVSEHTIMRQTGHKSSETIKKYIRIANQFEENAATMVGL